MVDVMTDELSGWQHLSDGRAGDLDPWYMENLDRLVEWEQKLPELCRGSALAHLDIRSDNLLIDRAGGWSTGPSARWARRRLAG